MSRIAIVTDSTCDLPASVIADRRITVIPLNLHIDGQQYRDQIDITTPDFMRRLVTAKALPTTSQPAPALFEEAYRRLAKDHDAILAVVLSSKLSGTHQSAVLGAEAVKPDIRVEVVDSLNASLGLGFQVLHAANLVDLGLPIETIASTLRAETPSYQICFFVDTLEYLQKGGRIGRAASLVGSMLQLKPLLRIEEGQVIPAERTRTRSRAVEALRSYALGLSGVRELGVLYSDNREEAERFADELSGLIPRERILIQQFSPVLGAHVGPGAMGVCAVESGSA